MENNKTSTNKKSTVANIHITGMTCAHCVSHVEKALQSVNGVISATVNLASEKATVEYLDGTTFSELKRAVEEAGYNFNPDEKDLTVE